jgi:hypothetical protein
MLKETIDKDTIFLYGIRKSFFWQDLRFSTNQNRESDYQTMVSGVVIARNFKLSAKFDFGGSTTD